jgi:prevent-host-death family protein
MLQEDEIERFRYVELSLSTLHGTGIYPEAARDTSELAALFAPDAPRVHTATIDEIANRPREIRGDRLTTNASEFRHRLTYYVAELRAGQAITIVRDGRFAYGVVSRREFDRLSEMHRIMRWFEAAGLDLYKANASDVIDFVRDFRERSAEASDVRSAPSAADQGDVGPTTGHAGEGSSAVA